MDRPDLPKKETQAGFRTLHVYTPRHAMQVLGMLCLFGKTDSPRRPSGIVFLIAPLALLASLTSLAGCHHGSKQDAEVKITFTQVPELDPGNRNLQDVMEGTVS